MLSIEKCKKILLQGGATYTEDEVKEIRKLLYKLSELDYQLFTAQKTKENDNSNHLH
jgi:hypothetical protein